MHEVVQMPAFAEDLHGGTEKDNRPFCSVEKLIKEGYLSIEDFVGKTKTEKRRIADRAATKRGDHLRKEKKGVCSM